MLHRLGGLLCLLLAAAVGWWGIWLPLQDAASAAPTIKSTTTPFVLVPLATVFGLFFLLFGDSVPYRDPARQTFTKAGWVLMLLATLASGAGFWWYQTRIAELGYSSNPTLTPPPQ